MTMTTSRLKSKTHTAKGKPTRATITLLDLMQAEKALLVRAIGKNAPFILIREDDTSKPVSMHRYNSGFVAELAFSNWLEGGVGRLVESYRPSIKGLERLNEWKLCNVKRATYVRRMVEGKQSKSQKLGKEKGLVFDPKSINAWQTFRQDYNEACREDPSFSSWDDVLDIHDHDHESWGPFNGPIDDGTKAAALRSAVAYLGADLATAMLRFFCLSEGIEILERRMNWPKRSGKLAVFLAARRLIDYYA